ncbi:Protein trichome birefringence-like [Actinidia chinensis var. chinensis]|uniref:Protein trichome birefringence-like n=1 Tax=Actinidia chinensis var. chinensis TaxID=1590841 RepID=A0A2R6RYF5_ACTCC|nr:Protein trichome birefringence-like [Actinidia chinensis var. chinensis]
MKLQVNELPLIKNQNRRKTPKIAPLIVLALVLLTIIPIYYPFLSYPTKNSSQPSSSSKISLCVDDLLSENGRCFNKEVEKSTADSDQDEAATTPHGGDVEETPVVSDQDEATTTPRGGDQEEMPVESDQDEATTSTPRGGDVEEMPVVNDQDKEATNPRGGYVEESPVVSNHDKDGDTRGVIEDNKLVISNERDEDTKPITRDGNLVIFNGRGEETNPALSNRDVVAEAHPGGGGDELPIGDSLTVDSHRDSATTSTSRHSATPDGHAKAAHKRRDVEKSPTTPIKRESLVSTTKGCDIFSGEWVPSPEGPYYTNTTCWAIQEHQNCMHFGRPDTQYLKWRWKPEGCELPIFDPFQFLELVRGKSMAFVGDSVARNHMQSLICLLSRVEEPVDVSEVPYESQFKRYEYQEHNFTIEIFWSPYLVRTTQPNPTDAGLSRPFNLFLDEFDEKWTTKIEPFDYVIISAGHWFFRPTMFYVKGRTVGCLYCPESNINHLTSYFSYRRAFRTAFRAINSLENYKGITFLRTFAPSHFEGGYWDKGGDCVRKKPFKKSEARMEGYNLEFYKIQMEEVKIARRIGRRKGLKYRLFDITQAMLLRPDGHPSKYGHWPQTNVSLANDCVHWCLPGPIDAWNEFLLELLKREEDK